MKNKKYQKWVLVIGFAILLWLLLRTFDLNRYLTFENLHQNKVQLNAYVKGHYLQSVIGFIMAYIIVVAMALPGAAIMTLAGGVMFSFWQALIFVNIGATVGATLSFMVARYIIGDWVQKRYADRLVKFNKEMDQHGKNYLLTLRLIPIFPFFMINLAAGLTKMSLRTFVWTTALGIIPGSFAYTLAGNNLSNISSPDQILSKEVLAVFVVLGLVSLIPAIMKRRIKPTKTNE